MVPRRELTFLCRNYEMEQEWETVQPNNVIRLQDV